ncbi:hypothetical protein ACFOEK_12210 [Litoribrevibacter euphylliae]|uniref:LPXTG cell wall anchor domain-containing protein n=1 Tax=Litoribrevibacter euphylliae TaxID=1834034 RepID=A0ABV7HGE6_9GAMM
MAGTETQEDQNFAWDSLWSGLTNVTVAGLGVMQAQAQAEPAPVSKATAVTAVSEATPVVAQVGQNNNGTTVIQPTTSGLMGNKTLLIGGGVAVGALVLVLALRK